MNNFSTIDYFLALTTIASIVFGFMWNRIFKPQIKLEKAQAVDEKEMQYKSTLLAQKEAEAKAMVLAKEVELERQYNREKNTEFAKILCDSNAIALNHIHTVDVKVEAMNLTVQDIRLSIAELTTIINERMPRKE